MLDWPRVEGGLPVPEELLGGDESLEQVLEVLLGDADDALTRPVLSDGDIADDLSDLEDFVDEKTTCAVPRWPH